MKSTNSWISGLWFPDLEILVRSWQNPNRDANIITTKKSLVWLAHTLEYRRQLKQKIIYFNFPKKQTMARNFATSRLGTEYITLIRGRWILKCCIETKRVLSERRQRPVMTRGVAGWSYLPYVTYSIKSNEEDHSMPARVLLQRNWLAHGWLDLPLPCVYTHLQCRESLSGRLGRGMFSFTKKI